MNARLFIEKWRASSLRERQASQSHFYDLCQLLGIEDPVSADPEGKWFTFDKELKAKHGKLGFADVWRKGCFAWEYKGNHANLEKALNQLTRYALNLDNPPLLIVSDMEVIEIHTNFQNHISETIRVELEDLDKPSVRKKLQDVFNNPNNLKPLIYINKLTEDAALRVAEIVKSLKLRYKTDQANRFVIQSVFAMFAEDIGLLPDEIFTRTLTINSDDPAKCSLSIKSLFLAMRDGGQYGERHLNWFNGGLFETVDGLELSPNEVKILRRAADLDWAEIDPAIFGTLFEQGLENKERLKLKAHYTDSPTIIELTKPVLIEPFLREFKENIEPKIEQLHIKIKSSANKASKSRLENQRDKLANKFLEKLRQTIVLDPACGSGNFLYVALRLMKDFEIYLINELQNYGVQPSLPYISPKNLRGIEKNAYAAELAKLTAWIGDIQWMLSNGFGVNKNPVLQPLENIICGDALIETIEATGEVIERAWPECSVIVGNPPFAGDKKMRSQMGDSYVEAVNKIFSSRLPAGSDFAMRWMVKAHEHLVNRKCKFVGLVNYNGTRQGVNLRVYEKIFEDCDVFFGVTDKEWAHEGASIRVCSLGFALRSNDFMPTKVLNGREVTKIGADLTAPDTVFQLDRKKLRRIEKNKKIAFQGPGTVGDFTVSRKTAADWLKEKNMSGKDNSDVLKRWRNGDSILKSSGGRWIIDFDPESSEQTASQYEAPFQHVQKNIRKVRESNRHQWRRENYWKLGNKATDMRAAISILSHYIATVRVAKHLIFVRLPVSHFPDSRLCVVASSDLSIFALLSSSIHRAWFDRLKSMHAGERPTYSQRTVFETFPFPQGLHPNLSLSELQTHKNYNTLVELGTMLDQKREEWQFPETHFTRVDEPDGKSKYFLAKNQLGELMGKKRTLTNLYNLNPEWLSNIHRNIDEIVFDCYGMTQTTDEKRIVSNLFELNQRS